jgi:uncharacterized membrane protein
VHPTKPPPKPTPGRRTPRHRRSGPDPLLPGGPHGHGHGPPAPVGRRVRILIAALLIPCALATLAGLLLLHPAGGTPPPSEEPSARFAGHVTTATEASCTDDPTGTGCVALTVAMSDGPLAGTTIVTIESAPRGVALFGPGDDVVLLSAGGSTSDPGTYQVVDFQRGTPLLALAALFAAAVVALGRWRGVAALGALSLTAAVLTLFVLPAILAGRNPLAVAVVGSGAIMLGALYLTHGVSARTSVAVIGTMASLLIIGGLGVAFSALTRLTGADEDTAALAAALGTEVDGRGLVLAGLVIGALGALDDVTVTQTSAVWELHAADPGAHPRTLLSAAMRIGRDHVASAVNTLVLAYAGTTLPLLLLFSVAERGLADTLTTQVIGTEIVRTLVGSIGLVAAVPVTTALAVAVVHRPRRR